MKSIEEFNYLRPGLLDDNGVTQREMSATDVAVLADVLTRVSSVDIDCEVEELLCVGAGVDLGFLVRLVVQAYRSAEMAGGRTVVIRDISASGVSLQEEATAKSMWDETRKAATVPWGYSVTRSNSGWRIE